MSKPVAVILVNWNTAVHTANCILSLKQYCNAAMFDIILVDNGSSDGSLHLLRARFSDVIFIDNLQNLGFAEGNNKGLKYSITNGYAYSLIINTDTLVDEDIITHLSDHLNKYPEAAAVQPAIYWMHDRARIWNGEGHFNQLLGKVVSNTKKISNDHEFTSVEWVTGCCMLVRNSTLTKTGLFNKHFFLYYEDTDLSFRLRAAGYGLHYLPSCKIYHEAGVSAKVNVQKKEGSLNPVIHYYTSRNHIWILRRYGKRIFYPIYLVYNGLYYTAVLAYLKLRGRNQKAKYLIKGLKEGIFTPKNLIWPN